MQMDNTVLAPREKVLWGNGGRVQQYYSKPVTYSIRRIPQKRVQTLGVTGVKCN